LSIRAKDALKDIEKGTSGTRVWSAETFDSSDNNISVLFVPRKYRAKGTQKN
jgi:hypothetical protein